MKAVFTISTSDLKAKAYEKMRKPEKVSYPSKASEDETLLRIIKQVLAER